MTEFEDRLRKYGTYLEQRIAEHLEESEGFASNSTKRHFREQAESLELARDMQYEIFPEIKPAAYKTVAERDA